MKTFYIYSFGCRVNQAEKETIDREMQLEGYVLGVRRPDIAIINTCAVTHKAEREAKQLIYQIRRDNPDGQVVITGCSATYWKKNNLLNDLPVDLVVDNINKEFLVKILQKRLSSQACTNLGGWFSGGQNKLKSDKYLNSGRVLIKIQDGCQRFCSFCIVPYLRGNPKSQTVKSLELKISSYATSYAKASKVKKASEDKKNLGQEIKEVIFTAINTEAFGFDTGETLNGLIKRILTKSSIPRISFGSIHPWSINNIFIEIYKKVLPTKRLVNFFHVPIQSGSNKILNLMKRGYTREEMINKLIELHKVNPLALIATDVIVGFLEETDKDFQDTYDFLEKSPISKFHIFRFSKRNNTAAFYLAKNLKEPSAKTKKKRAKLLADLGKKKFEMFQKLNIGRKSQALFISNREGDYQEALIDNQLEVMVKTEKDLTGQLMNINILEYKKGKLFGEIV